MLSTEILLAVSGSLGRLCTLPYHCDLFLQPELEIQPQSSTLHFGAAELDGQNSDFVPL